MTVAAATETAAAPAAASVRTTYREAVRQAMREALLADERVFLMGERGRGPLRRLLRRQPGAL